MDREERLKELEEDYKLFDDQYLLTEFGYLWSLTNTIGSTKRVDDLEICKKELLNRMNKK
jgi:hypothetical protein